MVKYIVLFACCMCHSVHATQQYDHVASVTVNGEELAKPLAFRKWKKILGDQRPKIVSAFFSECTGNYEVALAASNPVVRLEYYPEENRETDLAEVFAGGNPDITDNALKARVWLEWRALKDIRQVIRVGDMLISDRIRIETFAERFPLSYRKGGGSGTGDMTVFEVFFDAVRAEKEAVYFEEAPP